jgi:hypothetical protein
MHTKAVRYDKNTYHLVRDGSIVAIASALTNNRWQVNDTQDRRIDALGTFATPKAAADAYHAEFFA